MLQGIYRGYAGEFETPEKLFAANQKQMADYYAQRRAAETGGDPHVDMLLIDPNVGLQYRLHPPGAREMSRVRKLPKSAVRDSVNLYADGGLANLSTKYNQPELTHHPQPKTVNPLQSVARGWVAGTLGLPGDVEGLARMLARYAGANVDETPALPTADFYREWLPGKQEGLGAEAEGLGSLFGGVGSTALARPLVPALRATGRAANTGVNAGLRNLAAPGTLNHQTGAVVWHGSPHAFVKFDSSKIGTGEGAQAYGHGLYLAEAPDVSKTYMRTQINNAPELEQMALRAGASKDAANTIA